ncbi:MAG: hypothetical protein CMN75_08910 [Spirochaeta sp.]|nr:hypothetical protein [Spirochaeta sp.]RPG06219.1 MAG: DUF3127 domain-containing protein [Proteobacteria bacterium TMED72]
MGYRTNGKIYAMFDTEQKTERFRIREFVLEISDGGRFEQYVKFQLTGDRCESLDPFSKGDEIEVEFNLRGREWTSPSGDVRYFNSLDVWTLQASSQAGAGSSAGSGEEPPMPEEPPHFGEEPPF